MTVQSTSTPDIQVVEATGGVALAQAAGLFLRGSRVGEPWRAGASNRFLLAFVDGVPVAVGEVRPMPFGRVGVDRFRSAPGRDAAGLRAQLIDFLGGESAVGRSSDRPLAA